MFEFLLASQVYSSSWCNLVMPIRLSRHRRCEVVRVIRECREEYKLIEKNLILSPNVKDTHLVRICKEFEVNENNQKTGRYKIISTEILH